MAKKSEQKGSYSTVSMVIEFGTRLCDHDQRKWTSIFKSYKLFLVCVFHVTVFVSISISPCQTFLRESFHF
jgi:hypothetical protein